jgi:hypothetical protein
MKHLPIPNHVGERGKRAVAVGVSLGTFVFPPTVALADEGGVSFWVPGFFGSLAAAPQQPGWSLATIYYHTSVSAGTDVALEREFETGRIPTNLTGRLNASLSLSGTGYLGFVIPSYVFATPVLGGQAAAALAGAYGRVSTSVRGDAFGHTGNAAWQLRVQGCTTHSLMVIESLFVTPPNSSANPTRPADKSAY